LRFRLGLNQEAGGKAALGWSIERLDTRLEARGEILSTHEEEKGGWLDLRDGLERTDGDVRVMDRNLDVSWNRPRPPTIPTDSSQYTPPPRRCGLVSSVPTTSLPRWSTSTRLAPI